MRALMVTVACVLFLSACGIKGPLYMPPTDPAPNGTPPAEMSPNETPSTNTDGSK